MIVLSGLTYRTIDADRDAELVAENHRDACVHSFGDDARYEGRERYLPWLRGKAEEFPDGFVLALYEGMCVGHLELEVPYGSDTGYVNLFYVTTPFRGQGYGRLLNEYAEHYFRCWEADRAELHVSPTNIRAVGFYRHMGYRVVTATDDPDVRLWKMVKVL